MVLVLVIGDFFIPQRAIDIQAKFKKLLVPGKIQQILCTGNLIEKSVLDWLRTIAPDVQIVKGDYDEMQHPLTKVVQYGPLRIGLIHGHQLVPNNDIETLALTARHLDVDILCTGHSCQVECFEYEQIMFINPGSATGAWKPGIPLQPASTQSQDANNAVPKSTDTDTKGKGKENDRTASNTMKETSRKRIGPNSIPSFVLLDVQDTAVMIYVYQLINDEVKIVKMEYKKASMAAMPDQISSGMSTLAV